MAAVGGAGLQGYLVRRILLALPVLVGVSLLVFGVMRLAPGDPAAIMLGAQATREDVERLRRDLGLDRPVAVQYAQWMGRVLQGDLGRSIPLGREVLPEVLLRFKATVVLTAGALVIAIAVGLTAGIVSATRQYSWLDKLSMAVAVTGVSLPVFWTGIMLILVFALSLRWFPSAGMVSPYGGGLDDLLWHLVLPALTLGTASAAAVARLTRSSVLEIIRQDYVRAARAKGLAERAVMARHVLKNALNPILTVIGRPGRLPPGRRDPHRDRLLVAGARLDDGARDPGPRLSAGAGRRAPDRHHLRAGEPGRGPALRGLRPAHPL